MTDDTLTALQGRLNFHFRDETLLLRAMTHRSYTNESGAKTEDDNERLEFLGDAILNFVTADLLYKRYPQRGEGWLTRLRAALVRTESLGALAVQCDLGAALRMGKGEERNGGRERLSNLCAAFEALIGAVYTDGGIDAVRMFVTPLLEARLEVILREALHTDARTVFQEWSQSEHGITPVYRLVEESGPEHDRVYLMRVYMGADAVAEGSGHSKRAAAQSAARAALEALSVDLN
jgi:ribonuclease-3